MTRTAIVGAGFTGTVIAARLLRSLRGPTTVALIERSGRFGRGVAYGTACREHVLNVPAGRMSAFPEDQDHFLRWARERDPSVAGGSFVPRMMYGEYLGWTLGQAQEHAATGVRLERIADRAVGVRRAGLGSAVELEKGGEVEAARVVLAVGNFAPADPACSERGLIESSLYVRDPWSGDRLEGVPADGDVLLIGTGLTMIDVALELEARGHRGTIYAVSRRGLLPQPHRSPAVPYQPDRPADLDRWPRTALGMLKALRREVGRAAERRIDWREVVTALRADTPQLWASLSEREQRRFLERLRPFWDTHRHRSAAAPAAAIDSLIRTGRLVIVAGRMEELIAEGDGVQAVVRPRGEDRLVVLRVSRVVNCTGPDTDLGRCADPLIRNLRDQGLVRPDPLGLGLLTTQEGVSIGREGPVGWLTVAGPLRRAQLWENTAVPELRVEAKAAAERLAREIAAMSDACGGVEAAASGPKNRGAAGRDA